MRPFCDSELICTDIKNDQMHGEITGILPIDENAHVCN